MKINYLKAFTKTF